MTYSQTSRILAIEARRSRLGYALFEGPKRLLDWGASSVPADLTGSAAAEAARKRITSILRRCHPVAIVVKRPRSVKTGRGATPGPIMSTIAREAAALPIPVCFLGRTEIQDAFRIFRGNTKEEIAEVLVSIFPELLARLPPRQKKWQPERRVMVVFGAVAVGFAHWQRNGTKIPPPE